MFRGLNRFVTCFQALKVGRPCVEVPRKKHPLAQPGSPLSERFASRPRLSKSLARDAEVGHAGEPAPGRQGPHLADRPRLQGPARACARAREGTERGKLQSTRARARGGGGSLSFWLTPLVETKKGPRNHRPICVGFRQIGGFDFDGLGDQRASRRTFSERPSHGPRSRSTRSSPMGLPLGTMLLLNVLVVMSSPPPGGSDRELINE